VRRIRQRAIAAVALCALSSAVSPELPVFGSTPVLAQESALPSTAPGPGSVTPGGLWYGFSAGWGWSRVGCDVCRGDLVGGATGMLRAGITQSRALDLGLEVNGWHQDYEGVNRWHGTFSLMAYFYPGSFRRLVLSGGLGMTLYRASDTEDAFTSTSFGPQFGVGYEIPVGSGLTFTPQLDIVTAGVGDLQFNGETLGSGNLQLLKLGVGLTWR
jgi:hypothetical protein